MFRAPRRPLVLGVYAAQGWGVALQLLLMEGSRLKASSTALQWPSHRDGGQSLVGVVLHRTPATGMQGACTVCVLSSSVEGVHNQNLFQHNANPSER